MDNYKILLKQYLQSKKAREPKFTWAFVAKKLDVQGTYLSRVLNSDEVDLSEDLLFGICSLLSVSSQEYQYLSLLRQHATAENEERKNFLAKQIRQVKENVMLQADKERFGKEIEEQLKYLQNPGAVLVHVALHIKKYANRPDDLAVALGMTKGQFKKILDNLQALDYIEYNPTYHLVTKVKKSHIHFGKDHPIMRVHQYLFQNYCLEHIFKQEDDKRENFLVTFSADSKTYEFIRKEFRKFIAKVEKEAMKAPSEKLYQLSFSLFNWV
jgi:uncharacterized protein (TIGR02147 family)